MLSRENGISRKPTFQTLQDCQLTMILQIKYPLLLHPFLPTFVRPSSPPLSDPPPRSPMDVFDI